MRITKSQLRQIIKEEVKETLKEYINPNSSVNRRHRRFDHVPGRGVAPGTSGKVGDTFSRLSSDQPLTGDQLPQCKYDERSKKLPGAAAEWRVEAAKGLAANYGKARCAMWKRKVAWIGKEKYEYDHAKGGLQKDAQGNPIPKKG